MGRGSGGEAGHPSEGAMGGGMTSGGKKAPKSADEPKEKRKNALENSNVTLRMYPAEMEKYGEILKAKLAKVKGASNVMVDTKANWVNLTYTARKWEDAKDLERAADECAVPARLISPATVEFALTNMKGAPKQDRKKFDALLGETSLFDYELSGSTLKIQTSLLGTNWSGLFSDAADCGYTLTPKSHVFHRVVVKTAEKGEAPAFEEITSKLYKNKGILQIGQIVDQKGRFGLISTAEVPEKELAKILTDLGYTSETFE